MSRAGEVILRAFGTFRIALRALRFRISSLRRPAPHSGATPHLLIVSWCFPPQATTGAQLPAFLARHASRSRWRVTVVCGPSLSSPTEQGLAALGLVPDSVRVLRAKGRVDAEGDFHPQVAYRFSPGTEGGWPQAVSLLSAASIGLASDPPSHVLATGPSFGNFVVGMRLARYFRARLCLQYQDEWTVMRPSFVGTFKGDVFVERECLRAADLVWFVTEGKRRAYLEAFPEALRGRHVVIPPGWDPDVMAQISSTSDHLADLKGKTVIAFTGRVTNATPIVPFLRSLGIVLDRHPPLRNSVVLHVTGTQTADNLGALTAFGARYPGVVVLQPAVPQATAVEIMREATAVLLLNNTIYPGVVPLKVFDYMASGAPILVFSEMGEAGAMIEQTGSGICVPDEDPSALADALEAFGHQPRRHWNTAEREAWCREHNRATLTDRALAAMLESNGEDWP